MKKDNKLQVFKNKVVRKLSGSETDVIGRRNELHNDTPNDLHTSVTILSLVPSRLQQDAHIPWMEET
jgi:hypothetical protein